MIIDPEPVEEPDGNIYNRDINCKFKESCYTINQEGDCVDICPGFGMLDGTQLCSKQSNFSMR